MEIHEDHRSAWNEFVAASPYGDVLQCWEWGELKARTGWEPLHFAAHMPDKIVGPTCPTGLSGLQDGAVALVLKRRIPHTRRCLFYCPRGPIFDPARPEVLANLLAEISSAAREHGAVALKIDPAIPAGTPGVADLLREAGFRPASAEGAGFGGVQPRAVMKVDVTADEDTLLAGFHKKWRYNIRTAGRKGVTVKSDCARPDMDAFYDILTVTAQRDGFGVRSRSYYHDLWETIIQPGLGKLFMAYAEETPIAGAIAFVLGKQCWYVYGASDNEHRNLMPNHLVQWEMMRWAKSLGCAVYDMRGVSPERDGEPVDPDLAGLNRFKRGFGAEYVEYIGDWDLVYSPIWHTLFQRLAPFAKKLLPRR